MILRRFRIVSIVLAASVFSLAGCGNDRLTYQNYERVKDGMTADQVRAILGEPDRDRGGGVMIGNLDASGHEMRWKSGNKNIFVTFALGKVTAKSQKGLQ